MNKSLLATLALSTLALAISAPAHAAGLTNLVEGFENVSGLAPAWAFVNNSESAPTPPSLWTQGVTATSNYAAQSGSSNSFAQVDVFSTSALNAVVSNWLITPELDFTNGGVFSFYARTFQGNSFAEFIEVRQSNAGSSTNVGTAATSVGDFSVLVSSVGSPTNAFAFPGVSGGNNKWGLYTFSIAPTAGSGRLAFRYFATDSGVNGLQNQYATIDTVNYVATPEPSSMAGMLLIGGLGAAARLRNKAKKAQA
jgi:hypothetical protein